MIQNVQEEFVNMKIWDLFCMHFKSHTTSFSYWSDIQEFCRYTKKPFVKTEAEDVESYFLFLKKNIKEGEENEKEMDNSSALPQHSDYDDRNFCQSR